MTMYPATAWYIFTFLTGLCVGSFLNVCIWRIPRGESVVFVPSHCPKCDHAIAWYENIPLASYLFLRGKCSECGQKISPQYFLIELLTGILFVAAYAMVHINHMPVALLGIYYAVFMLCVAGAIIDCRFRILPDKLNYTAMIFGLVYAAFLPKLTGADIPFWQLPAQAAAAGAVVALLLSLFALGGRWIFKQDALGWGDVKFMTAIAILMGVPASIFTLMAGSLLGVFYGAFFVAKKKKRRKVISFGPFLAAGAILWIFTGRYMMQMISLFLTY